jgi:hypothetical protein
MDDLATTKQRALDIIAKLGCEHPDDMTMLEYAEVIHQFLAHGGSRLDYLNNQKLNYIWLKE